MNNFDILRAALAAGPTAGPWTACEWSYENEAGELEACGVSVAVGQSETVIQTTAVEGDSEADVRYIAAANPATIAALLAELDDARADLAKHKAHIRLTNDIITNHCIAMQSALIEQSIGKGDEAALDWIGNTLAGPGLLPSMSDAAHLPETPTKGPAQAWFDAKTAEHDAMRARQDAATKGAA